MTDGFCIYMLLSALLRTLRGLMRQYQKAVIFFFKSDSGTEIRERQNQPEVNVILSSLKFISLHRWHYSCCYICRGITVTGNPSHTWQPDAGTGESGSTLLNRKCPPCLTNTHSSLICITKQCVIGLLFKSGIRVQILSPNNLLSRL